MNQAKIYLLSILRNKDTTRTHFRMAARKLTELLALEALNHINMKKISLSELLIPIKSLFYDKSTQFAFLTLIAIASYSIIDKVAVNQISPMLHVYFLTLFAFILFTPYILRTNSQRWLCTIQKTRKTQISVYMLNTHSIIKVSPV